MSLIEGLHEQMNRARELRKMYEEIPTGAFGIAVIDATIKQAERSIESGNIGEMMATYNALEELE
jgi:hypothetical protein